MGLNAELHHTTVLTPTERERRKTPQQRAEDVIYTLNHTFTCLTLTDLFLVPILRGFGLNIGHGHDHTTDPASQEKEFKQVQEANRKAREAGKAPAKSGLGNAFRAIEKQAVLDDGASAVEAESKSISAYVDRAKPSVWKRIANEIKHAFGHFSWKGAGNWFVGEAIGDVGAAFVTIPVQRFFPGFMESLRRGMEPVVGGFFKRGAENSAHKWADKRGLAYDNEEVVARAKDTYEYEMRHLPQMAVWTGSSIGLHYGVMKWLEKEEMTIGKFARQKAATSAITAAVVFGVRALSPDKAYWWDKHVGSHVVVPLTKSAGKLFGVKEREVDEFHARAREAEGEELAKPVKAKNWSERVKDAPAAQAVEAARG